MTLIKPSPKRGNNWGVKVWSKTERKHVWLGTRPTREEALELERSSPLAAKSRMPTVREWAAIWLSDYARPAAATRLVYAQATRRIVKDLGHRRLDGVTRLEARQYANRWPRNVSAVARTMWGDGANDDVCSENPWSNLRLKQSRGRKDIRALTEGQVLELADMAGELRPVVLTLGFVGLRPGELCGLRWEDLDLAAGLLRVARSVDATGAEKLPKTGVERVVTVPPVVADALRGMARDVDGYVFHTVTGRRLNKASLFYAWRPVRERWVAAGNDPLDLYALRHAAATILLERGLSAADVAVQLGHVDGGILVLERYGHPDRDLALDRLRMAFSTPVRDRDRGAETA